MGMPLNPAGTHIGFIGTGVMGASMARHLLEAGAKLTVYNRSRHKAEPLLAAGAQWADGPEDVAREADVVITMVGFPTDVEEVYLGEGGLIESAKRGAYLIDMTTSDPQLAVRIWQAAQERGLHALDAPVSGGDIGARNGTLTIMVGGTQEDFEAVLPILRCMGRNIILQGGPGAGQHTKMCNQIAIASNMIGVCEAVSYAIRAGLDPRRVLESITGGAAGSWSLSHLAPRMIEGDYQPGFYIKHFLKDMRIALESAQRMGLPTPGLALAKSLYEELAEAGDAELGTQALIRWFEHHAVDKV
jgi:3-hydroxyisobutyrate dehydrogenase